MTMRDFNLEGFIKGIPSSLTQFVRTYYDERFGQSCHDEPSPGNRQYFLALLCSKSALE